MMKMSRTRWIQGANIHRGALHAQLGYPSYKHIPVGLLERIEYARIGTHVQGHTVTPLLKHRVNFALNVRH